MDQKPVTVTSLIKRLKDIQKQFGDLEVRLWSNSIKDSKKKPIYPICIITYAPEQYKKVVVIL